MGTDTGVATVVAMTARAAPLTPMSPASASSAPSIAFAWSRKLNPGVYNVFNFLGLLFTQTIINN